jgi:DUF971 family protein
VKPKSIKKTGPLELKIAWDDGEERTYPLGKLRDLCPCAGCAGETILMREYVPPPIDQSVPGRYELKDIQMVGSYAVQMVWGDGHATGIYSFEYLKNFPH